MRRERRARWLLAAVAVAAALELGYLILANLFLASAWSGRVINRRPEKLLVEWERARSYLPGWVELAGVRLRGQNRRIQWFAELERARVAINLLQLPRKRFDALWMRGRGLAFRLRPRLAPGSPARPASPPIPGLANPPEPAPEETSRPAHPGRRGWQIDLRDFTIEDVGELWLGDLRLAASGRLGGDLSFRVRGHLASKRLRYESGPGRLFVGSQSVAERLELALDGELSRFMPREAEGREHLRHLSGRLRASGEIASLGFLDIFLERAPWLELDGRGRLALDLLLREGALLAGSRLDFQAPQLVAGFFGYRASGAGAVRGAVTEEAGAGPTRLDVALERFAIERAQGPGPRIAGESLQIALSAGQLDLGRGELELRGRFELPPTRIEELDAYGAALPRELGLAVRSGAGTVSGHLEVDTGRDTATGRLELTGADVAVDYGDLALAAGLELTAPIRGATLSERRFDLGGTTLTLSGVRALESPGAAANGWWARIAAPQAELTLSDRPRISARVEARMRDSLPLVAVLLERKPLLAPLRGLLTVDDVQARAGIETSEASTRIRDLAVRGEDLEILAELALGGGSRRGIAYFRHGSLAAGLELAAGETDWRLRRPRQWYDERAAGLASEAAPAPPAPRPP